MDIKELESGVNPKTHWYYQSKKIPLYKFVKKIYHQLGTPLTIIDFGAGSGFFSYDLQEHYPEMIKKIFLVDTEYSDKELEETRNHLIEKRREIPSDIELAIVIMMEVLEHIKNDEAVLLHLKSKCRQNCYFFITVPAFMSLWSGHDIFLGHFRRYRIPTLRNLLQRAGIEASNISYLYAGIFPLVWLVRRLKRKSRPHSTMSIINPIVNLFLKNYNSVEMKLDRFNKLFGVTCCAEGKIC